MRRSGEDETGTGRKGSMLGRLIGRKSSVKETAAPKRPVLGGLSRTSAGVEVPDQHTVATEDDPEPSEQNDEEDGDDGAAETGMSTNTLTDSHSILTTTVPIIRTTRSSFAVIDSSKVATPVRPVASSKSNGASSSGNSPFLSPEAQSARDRLEVRKQAKIRQRTSSKEQLFVPPESLRHSANTLEIRDSSMKSLRAWSTESNLAMGTSNPLRRNISNVSDSGAHAMDGDGGSGDGSPMSLSRSGSREVLHLSSTNLNQSMENLSSFGSFSRENSFRRSVSRDNLTGGGLSRDGSFRRSVSRDNMTGGLSRDGSVKGKQRRSLVASDLLERAEASGMDESTQCLMSVVREMVSSADMTDSDQARMRMLSLRNKRSFRVSAENSVGNSPDSTAAHGSTTPLSIIVPAPPDPVSPHVTPLEAARALDKKPFRRRAVTVSSDAAPPVPPPLVEAVEPPSMSPQSWRRRSDMNLARSVNRSTDLLSAAAVSPSGNKASVPPSPRKQLEKADYQYDMHTLSSQHQWSSDDRLFANSGGAAGSAAKPEKKQNFMSILFGRKTNSVNGNSETPPVRRHQSEADLVGNSKRTSGSLVSPSSKGSIGAQSDRSELSSDSKTSQATVTADNMETMRHGSAVVSPIALRLTETEA